MPLVHCQKCHHEWEAASKDELCDWCGKPGTVIAEKTFLEKMLEDYHEE